VTAGGERRYLSQTAGLTAAAVWMSMWGGAVDVCPGAVSAVCAAVSLQGEPTHRGRHAAAAAEPVATNALDSGRPVLRGVSVRPLRPRSARGARGQVGCTRGTRGTLASAKTSRLAACYGRGQGVVKATQGARGVGCKGTYSSSTSEARREAHFMTPSGVCSCATTSSSCGVRAYLCVSSPRQPVPPPVWRESTQESAQQSLRVVGVRAQGCRWGGRTWALSVDKNVACTLTLRPSRPPPHTHTHTRTHAPLLLSCQPQGEGWPRRQRPQGRGRRGGADTHPSCMAACTG